jgi:hypothetical protein
MEVSQLLPGFEEKPETLSPERELALQGGVIVLSMTRATVFPPVNPVGE